MNPSGTIRDRRQRGVAKRSRAVKWRIGGRTATVALAGAAALVALVGCAKPAANNTGAAGNPEASVDPSAQGLGRDGNPDASPSAGNGTGTASPKASTSKSPSTRPGPTVVYFKITQHPQCPNPEAPNFPGDLPTKIAWKVTGATGVAISVDDPNAVGSYGKYGLEGELELGFACDTSVGSTGKVNTHRYTLHTIGGGAVVRRDLSASAKSK